MSALETYQNDITKYLTSKLEAYNVPEHIIMEVAQYTLTQTIIVSNEETRRACRDMSKRTYHYVRGKV